MTLPGTAAFPVSPAVQPGDGAPPPEFPGQTTFAAGAHDPVQIHEIDEIYYELLIFHSVAI